MHCFQFTAPRVVLHVVGQKCRKLNIYILALVRGFKSSRQRTIEEQGVSTASEGGVLVAKLEAGTTGSLRLGIGSPFLVPFVFVSFLKMFMNYQR